MVQAMYYLGIVAVSISCMSAAWTQSPALPTRLLIAMPDKGTEYVERFEYPAGGSDETIKCTVAMNNQSEKKVSLRLAFKKGSAAIGHHVIQESLSFYLTAVARRSAITDTLYVAGWSPRGPRIIVEEWELGNLSIGVANPIGGGESETVLVQGVPGLTKRVLYVSDPSDALEPISGLACNPYGNELYLLEYDTPRMMHRLDVVEEEVELAWLDLSAYPTLISPISLSASRHTQKGQIILVVEHLPWEDPMAYANPLQDVAPVAGPQYLVIEDSNLDGLIDSLLEVDEAAYDAYFSSGTWMKAQSP